MAAPASADSAALSQARQRLADDPRLAAIAAREILERAPGAVEARLILGAALRRSDDPAGALEVLQPLAQAFAQAWGIHYELGAALAALGQAQPAIQALTQAVALNPRSFLARHALGDQWAMLEDDAAAEAAYGVQVSAALSDPALVRAARGVLEGDLGAPVIRLRDQFNLHLTDLLAVRLLAEIGLRLGLHREVEEFLTPQAARAPRFLPLRHALALALVQQHKIPEALAEIEHGLRLRPRSTAFLALRAAVLVHVGDYEPALDIYRDILARHPDRAAIWLAHGHILKTVGRQAESVLAYRQALALRPALGEAYWSLANLKVVRFEPSDLEAMRTLLARPDLGQEDRIHLHFALGKALEDAGRFDAAFTQYQSGAALRRASLPYDAAANRDYVRRAIATFTPRFFADRADGGCPAPDPIFIVGLPRSGSTLVEQMLSSHSAVEGTSELPDMTDLARDLARRGPRPYPERLAMIDPAERAALGEAYLARARLHRKTRRPRFIDKFPNNFMHIGLIHLILPNARIIDVRRDAMACGLSGFKQLFAQGQAYSYDLGDLGAYYADYVALMAHIDAVLPGRVHQLSYERLIDDPEAELRRLLGYCGLAYEEACLRFHESARPVRTASSEQVRRPISREGIDHWRHFEPWLGPLRAALEPDPGDREGQPVRAI